MIAVEFVMWSMGRICDKIESNEFLQFFVMLVVIAFFSALLCFTDTGMNIIADLISCVLSLFMVFAELFKGVF